MNSMPFLNRTTGAALAVALLMVVALPGLALGGVEGVSYTFTPSYEVVQWDDGLGLEDTELLGGRLGLNFGEYLRLEGYYLARNGVETDLAKTGLFDTEAEAFSDHELDLSTYGATFVLNLATGPVVPFFRTGGGIFRFKNGSDDDFRQINLRAGGGLRFGIDRYTAEIFVEDSALRLNRYDLAGGGGTSLEDPEDEEVRHNLTVGVGLNFKLGGYDGPAMTTTDQAILERYRSGLRGVSIPVEPFVGRLDFNNDLGLDNQELIGVRAGVDLGPYLGLRGYYWHGVSQEFDRTDPIQSWGGELQFNLSSGQGAVPFLLAGVGEIDFKDDYFASDSVSYSDKTVLILGGGLAFNLSDRFRAQISARDYLFSESSADAIRGADDIQSNLMLSAGVRFSFGGAGAPRTQIPPMQPEVGVAPVGAATETAPSEPVATAPAATTPVATTPAPTVCPAPCPMPCPTSAPTPAAPVLLPSQTLAGERIIPIPVPQLGELYVRYGQPGGVSIESQGQSATVPAPAAPMGAPQEALTRDAIRQMLREELDRMSPATPKTPAAEPTGDLSPEERMELMEMRVAERVGDRMEKVMRDQMAQMHGDQPASPTTVVITDETGTRTVEGKPGQETVVVTPGAEPYHWKPREIRPYTGMNVDSPEQGLLGVRVDMGPVTQGSKFKLMPELAFGFGSGGTSYLMAGNLRYDFGRIGRGGTATPYVMVGAGLFGSSVDDQAASQGVVNLAYGLTMNIGRRVVFIEHQGIDLYNLHRVLAGLRFAW